MRLFLTIAAMIAYSMVPAQAQPWGGGGGCPPQTRPSGSFCLIDIPDSVRNRGICPAGYVSTADRAYCVLEPRKEWVRTRSGCPAGFRPSPGGEFCAAD
ncbi:hypothetical protein [Microvirga pakistanensis]|uniref:hypothetical protein n=1 Tax=Microvirga pakistanensis TaxID=1682650 RepID=UPI00106A3762|nr:hypothetical protein [Microvirga pakistanensis]